MPCALIHKANGEWSHEIKTSSNGTSGRICKIKKAEEREEKKKNRARTA